MRLFSALILILFSLGSFSAEKKDDKKETPLKWSGNIYKRALTYKKLHRKFSKEVCSNGADQTYYKYLRRYRGTGFYLPLLHNEVDRKAIIANLPKLKKKINYIEKTAKKLDKLEKLPDFKEVSEPLKETLRKLLNYKKEFSQSGDKTAKEKIRTASHAQVQKLKSEFESFIKELFFLKSFNFPNDHLANRKEYEMYKDREDKKSQLRANKTFFMRKIVEDGTYNRNHGGSDLYLRSTLDSLYLAIQKEKDFISENIRYDLEWTFRVVESVLSRSLQEQKDRLAEWEKRTRLNLNFYKDIVKIKNRKKAKKLVKEKNDATIRLKEYVYTKQAETYKWWMKQPELMRAVYVLETILFNEVGRVDGKDALERADVAQIVLNRIDDPFYSDLDPNQELVKHLGLSPSEYKDNKWLNTLFRVGEFSFTYHYISSVVKIFCPDMSRIGRNLRAKNIKLSLEAINERKEKFNVLRYFSRVSMLGKIDMSTVWFDYQKYPERPGYEVQNQRTLVRLYLAGKYQYLYSFEDPEGRSFQVVKIGEDTFSVRWRRGRPLFHKYRDPHLFKYFIKK